MKQQTPFSKTWVKICGFTRKDNAAACAAFAPNAMGFVFFKKSPRNISTDMAAQIIQTLPDTIMPVGVFVNKARHEIDEIIEKCSLKGVQLHGDESVEDVRYFKNKGLFVIKALFAKKAPDLTQAPLFKNASAILVEYGKGVLPGGNAESWNYEISALLNTDLPVILAGGLGPETVRDAMKKSKAFGADVSSGVESSYGIKDPEKVADFIKTLRS